MSHFSVDTFRAPASCHAPVYTWGWKGRITEEGIWAQMREMCENDIHALYVSALPKDFRPVINTTSLEPDYLTDEFMHLMRVVVDTAEELGMTVWLYDEGGWPSGSACTQVIKARPDLKRKIIQAEKVPHFAGVRYRPPVEQQNFLAAYLEQEGQEPVRIVSDFTADTDVTITEYRWCDVLIDYTYTTEYNNDIAHPDTGKLFIELTHEKYSAVMGEKFGPLVPLIFDDEPSLNNYAWTPGLEEMFLEKYGYDMRDYLPWIMNSRPWQTEAQRQAIIDYRLLLGELVLKNFFLPIRHWCEQHGIASSGHLDADHRADTFVHSRFAHGNPMNAMRSFHIPAIDVIWHQIAAREYPSPQGTPATFFPRFASSAARQMGGNLAATESLGVYGDGTTPDEIRYVMSYQAVRGINMLNLMAMCYNKDRGYAVNGRPLIDPAKPGYSHRGTLNAYMSRLSYLGKLGIADNRAALYLPVNDLLVGGSPDAFHDLGKALEEAHIDFDIVDDDILRAASVQDGRLCAGIAAYERIYVPEGARLPADVAEKIAPFTSAEIAPSFTCASPHLRGIKRILPDGSHLYLIFNQADHAVEDIVSLPESGAAYLLHLTDGKVYAAPVGGQQTISLESGELVALLYTDAAIATDTPVCETVWELPLDGFTARRLMQFRIQKEGISSITFQEEAQKIPLGPWEARYGHEFSGEAVYRCEAELPEEPLPGDTYELDLGKVEYTASVSVNGQPVGVAAMTPFVVSMKGEQLTRRSVIEITVANTASNECVTADIRSFWPQGVVGPYHQTSLPYERACMGGGLIGPVVLRKKR